MTNEAGTRGRRSICRPGFGRRWWAPRLLVSFPDLLTWGARADPGPHPSGVSAAIPEESAGCATVHKWLKRAEKKAGLQPLPEVDTGITVINVVALAITALAGWPTLASYLPRYPPPTMTVEGVA